MTQPKEGDTTSLAGAHPGAASFFELQQRAIIKIDTSKSLTDTANEVVSAADWHATTFANVNTAPNYASDPGVVFYGNGSMSLFPRIGGFIVSALTNEPTRGALRVDEKESNFYSSMSKTTLGTLDIDTVDGFILNPLSSIFPSTNFSPTKPWIRKLFPSISTGSLVKIAILELIHITLLRVFNPNTEESKQIKESIDMGTIFVNNSDLENQLFNEG